MPPPEPRASLTPLELPPTLRADGLHPIEEAHDPRELTDDERAASWLHTGLGFEVG